jgi:DNA adenine methylase
VDRASKGGEKKEVRRSESQPCVQPFLKWPGGKRWLVPTLIQIIGTQEFETYREPFLGGGALFFSLRPKQCVLSDVNSDLINTYRQVKNNTRDLLRHLQRLPVDQATYDRFRQQRAGTTLERAIRFLYLNRTAFGGMYRLNQDGAFNVPFGGGERTTAPLWKYDLLRSAARVLRTSKLQAVDFEEALSAAAKGDLVYCDPTYTVAHNNNGFIRYNERNFSWEDQNRLARCCRAAASRGALVLVSNAYHDEVLRVFDPPQHLVVSRPSRLCPQIEHRRTIDEFIFLFPPRTAGAKRAARRGIHEK